MSPAVSSPPSGGHLIGLDEARVPKTVPFYGGKSATSKHSRVGRWIARNLPRLEIYAEPFAGMCGVLLQRKRALCEIVNDSDARIVNWWRCVRDRPGEFESALMLTPRSAHEFERAKRFLLTRSLDDPSDPNGKADIEMGIATHIMLADSLMHGLGQSARKMHFAECYTKRFSRSCPDIPLLAHRLRKVQLFARDATHILRKLKTAENAVIYCDPPYETADTTNYGADDVDREALTALLLEQRGMVAISGYGDEWNRLGWPAHDFPSVFTGAGESSGRITTRLERVWINRPIRGRGLFGAAPVAPVLLPGSAR